MNKNYLPLGIGQPLGDNAISNMITQGQDISQNATRKAPPDRKPPVGPKPEWIVIINRLNELRGSISRYADNRFTINPMWVIEYNKLFAEFADQYPNYFIAWASGQQLEQQP